MKIYCEPFKGLGSPVVDFPDTKKCPYSGVCLVSKAKEALKTGAPFAICRIFYMVKKVEKKEFVDAAYLLEYWNKKLNFYRPGTKEKLKEAHLFVITSEKEGFQFKEKTKTCLVTASWRKWVAS